MGRNAAFGTVTITDPEIVVAYWMIAVGGVIPRSIDADFVLTVVGTKISGGRGIVVILFVSVIGNSEIIGSDIELIIDGRIIGAIVRHFMFRSIAVEPISTRSFIGAVVVHDLMVGSTAVGLIVLVRVIGIIIICAVASGRVSIGMIFIGSETGDVTRSGTLVREAVVILIVDRGNVVTIFICAVEVGIVIVKLVVIGGISGDSVVCSTVVKNMVTIFTKIDGIIGFVIWNATASITGHHISRRQGCCSCWVRRGHICGCCIYHSGWYHWCHFQAREVWDCGSRISHGCWWGNQILHHCVSDSWYCGH